MRVLVTGGAGYVGSHCARRLAEDGFEVVTVDDLSQGWPEAAVGRLVRADLRDARALDELLSEGFDCVLHFAAQTDVPSSVRDPLTTWQINVGGTLELLAAMERAGCDKLVFSSTCAIFGVPSRQPMDESLPFAPVSPYGETKAVVERILQHARDTGRVRSVSLRYFNAAGASEDGWIGEAHEPETHLIPIALEAAASGGEVPVFGTDFSTPDGTCVRDYVHVLDLADAHHLAVRRLLADGAGGGWNLGTGAGNSVREVLDRVEAITGRPVARRNVERRPGDPPVLVADPRRAQAELGWRATRTLDDAIRTAWAWYRAPRYGPRAP